ncbi:uncharacterized protein isoform X1 [Choristoneura fumiferana]|uniref:uncharacterized protein isoform X1 n=1 Tax=Choristoneura fumiferana TaxID=7141 RepID=UPI003D153EFC
MTKLLSTTARVIILTANIFIAVRITNADQIAHNRLSDSALLSNILEKLMGPYVKSFQVALQDNLTKINKDSTIEKEIEKKIDKLKLVLDENSGKEPLEHDSEDDTGDTKIIEFSPLTNKNILRDKHSDPEPVKNHFKKYKKLQQKVKEVLEKEMISDKAKSLVATTLDELINELMSSQCTWRNRAEKVKGRNQDNSLQINRNAMIVSWKKKWEELIDRYSLATRNKDADGSDYKEVFLFLLRLREFFFEIHNELNTLNGQYKVKCQLVDKNNKSVDTAKKFKVVNEGNSLRQSPKRDDLCEYVKICSAELKSFLTDYYINIMETVDTVFKNYGEMYIRDANTASSKDKRSFVSLIKVVNKAVDGKIRKMFNQEIDKLVLDVYNSTKAKVSAIKKCVKITAVQVQTLTADVLKEQLKPLDAKMRLTVKKDITTTIGIEIDNLENIFRNKMCTMFQTCNGNITRRFFMPMQRDDFDKNSVFVKLDLDFNDLEPSRRIAGIPKVKREEKKHATGYNRYQASNSMSTFDPERYLMNYTVTRTTFYIPLRKGTTISKTKEYTEISAKTENVKTTVGKEKIIQ